MRKMSVRSCPSQNGTLRSREGRIAAVMYKAQAAQMNKTGEMEEPGTQRSSAGAPCLLLLSFYVLPHCPFSPSAHHALREFLILCLCFHLRAFIAQLDVPRSEGEPHRLEAVIGKTHKPHVGGSSRGGRDSRGWHFRGLGFYPEAVDCCLVFSGSFLCKAGHL